MGLSTTLSIAQAALQANANQTTVVSKNIAGVNDAGYSRRIASLTTQADGIPTVTVSRSSNTELFNQLLSSTSDAQSADALSSGLDALEQTVNLTSSASNSESSTDKTSVGTSPAALLASLTAALTSYAAAPDNTALGQAFLSDAKALASKLNAASTTVQTVRKQADTDIANAVTDANALLSQFTAVNTAIVTGTATGADISDQQDKRDSILTALSKDMGIVTTTNVDGSMSIYTDSGVTLFDRKPNTITFSPTTTFADGTTGNAVVVAGIPITGSSSVMPLASGSIAGLTGLRDTTTVAYQNQLNQIASGLVTVFADSDQTGGSAATIPGLFTYSGSPAMPSTGQTGLAAAITVNANADPSKGGSLARMRDGNVGDPTNAAYNANTTGAAAFSTRLMALGTALNTAQTFDATSGAAASGTLAAYAGSSVSWLEASRSTATATSTSASALVNQATTSLSNSTGVNLDDQLSQMLDLEHSYSASAELMSTVKSMFGSLISAMQ
ncbi:flagellar hook-associated protein FlgK [Lichenihabitans sp. Uapishka_5]|uniref:flagellar hook-associated protein FlgK n=1 Tax=Lichenihabitans sp. Uapishka_5 TaxID=3037302 RepID=UPI0029E7F5C4|nr:flagellar hook-associated protein FlgK [Lichenihabitans sp. Uapishka_5]MDX7953065.1 flagellar hook-associated protein FlgK [Lichenihabitans sp. Uapishka_5]